MKNLKNLVGASTLILGLLSGCDNMDVDVKREVFTKQEDAIVYKEYVPTNNAAITGLAIGIIWDKPLLGLIVGNMLDDEYLVKFDGEDDIEVDSVEMYNKFNSGDRVKVKYYQIMESIYRMNKGKEFLKQNITNCFIDAIKK
jgi:hypothetical protein